MMLGSDWLLPLSAVACTAGLLTYLLPEGQQARLSGALKGFTGLCILLVIIQPLQTTVAALHKAADDPSAFGSRLSELIPAPCPEADGNDLLADSIGLQTQSEIEAWVTEQLQTVFGIPAQLCRVRAEVSISLSDDGHDMAASVEQVWIQLTGQAALVDPHAIEAYFTRQLEGGCTVSIGG